MWGHCHGQSVVVPTETPFGSIHEVFASFAGLVTLAKLNYVCFFAFFGVLGIKEAIPHGVLFALKRHTRGGWGSFEGTVSAQSRIRFPDLDEPQLSNASMNFCQKQTGKNSVQTWPSAAPCVTHLPMVTEVQTGLSVLDSLSQVQTQISHATLNDGSFMSGIITNTFLLTFLLMTQLTMQAKCVLPSQ